MANERTPAGGMIVRAALARVGVARPSSCDGSPLLRIYSPSQEVFDPESLASFEGVPVTIRHPVRADGVSTSVTPKNWRDVAVGHVVGAPRSAGALVHGKLLIEDADAIGRTEAGKLYGVSSSFECEVDPTPGVFEGEPYDVIARRIRYNHVALLPNFGANGPDVRIHLDGATATRFTKQKEKPPMENVTRYDGTSHADGVAHGKALALRYKLEAAGIDVPQGKSDAYIIAFAEVFESAGKLAPRADSHATAGARLAKLMDPFGVMTAVRTDAASDAKNETELARERMIQRQRDAHLTRRSDRDASREPRVRRPTTPAPSGTPRIPSSEYVAPASFHGNTGNAAGALFGDEDGWESAGNDARDAMMAKQRDAWKKPKADRKGRGNGGNWDPNGKAL
jgi:hypothetical protein